MASEIQDMQGAVRRLTVDQRQVDDPVNEPAPDPYEDYDEDQRMMLGVTADETIELEVDGKMVKVPVSKLPENFRAAPAPVAAVQATAPAPANNRIAELDQTITALQGQLKRPTPPDRKLATEDPDAFNAEVANYNMALIDQQDSERALQQAQYTRNQEAHHYQQQAVAAEQNALGAAWPEWGNPKSRSQVTGQLRNYAERNGYSPQEAVMIADGQVDHRLVLTLREAMRAEILAKPAKRKARATAPKVGSPGVTQPEATKQTRKRNDFIRKADREGVNVREAAAFLAGRYS